MWLASLLISIGLLMGVGVAAIVINGSHYTKKHHFSLFHALFAGVFVSAIVMFFPLHYGSENPTLWGGWRAGLLSLFNSMQIFGGGCEFSIVHEGVANCPNWLDMTYQLWAATLFVLAPVFTFGFVLSLFRNLSANAKYFAAFFKDVYVFSELNDKSLVLAKDMKSKNNRAVIVFTDVFEGNEEISFGLVEEAKKLRAICFKSDILVVNFKRHSSAGSISFFAIGANETDNLNHALKILEKYKERENTHLYVFSTGVESEILLSSAEKGAVKVRRINEVQSLINRVLYEHGKMIFRTDNVDADGMKKISAVVIGMGRHGTEMVKALAWFGQMDGYDMEINAFDKDPLAEERFVARAPELMSKDYNGVTIDGEAHYQIRIHSGSDVDTSSFFREISKIKNATYVLVALGNDDVNISTAVNLRTCFERMKIHPTIQAIVYNSQQKKALHGIKNFQGQAYEIEFIGDMESSYTQDVMIDSELEEAALQRHLSYVSVVMDQEKLNKKKLTKWLEALGTTEEALWKRATEEKNGQAESLTTEERTLFEALKAFREKEEAAIRSFWDYEYNYRSSVASAIHMRARVQCGIPGADKKEEELTAQERRTIEILEHKRWNAYMRAEGYIFSGSKEKSSRNDLGKMHHDLVDYSSLTEAEKRKDGSVGAK